MRFSELERARDGDRQQERVTARGKDSDTEREGLRETEKVRD